ncbi:beta-lactamase-like protein [Sparassis latifolia]
MSPTLKSVDRLVVKFIVDNSVEWLTTLPPGFTHERPQHLFEQKPELCAISGVPVIDLEKYCCGAHGFSALIETQVDGETYLILFDTGPDSRTMARNLDALQVPIERIERVILSHWHADHSGGLLTFLQRRASSTLQSSPCIVDLHPDRPIFRGVGSRARILGRLPSDPTLEQIAREGGVVETRMEGHAVAGGSVWVSGEIPRVTEWEGGILGGVRWVEEQGKGEWVKDEFIMDERYAVVDVAGKGLVIFSACSHAGIVNVVKDVTTHFSRPVHMIIGGLHLAGTDLAPRIAPTVNFLAKEVTPPPQFILPMHCTGFGAKLALEAAFGEGCVPAGVGVKVEVTA